MMIVHSLRITEYREILVLHDISCQWIEVAGIKFWQNEKSRMPRKVNVLLGQRLHIFLLNQAVLIRNFSRLIFPIWSLVDFRCDAFPCWIVRNNDF